MHHRNTPWRRSWWILPLQLEQKPSRRMRRYLHTPIHHHTGDPLADKAPHHDLSIESSRVEIRRRGDLPLLLGCVFQPPSASVGAWLQFEDFCGRTVFDFGHDLMWFRQEILMLTSWIPCTPTSTTWFNNSPHSICKTMSLHQLAFHRNGTVAWTFGPGQENAHCYSFRQCATSGLAPQTATTWNRAQHLLGSGVICRNDLKPLCSMAHHQSTSTHQKVFPRGASLDCYSSTSMLGPTRSRRGNFGFWGSRLGLNFWEFLCGRLTGTVGTGTISPNNLTWSAHVDAVHSKVARTIGAMKSSSRQLTRHARWSFFLTVIQPDLAHSAVKSSSRQLTRHARWSFFLTVIQPDLEHSAVKSSSRQLTRHARWSFFLTVIQPDLAHSAVKSSSRQLTRHARWSFFLTVIQPDLAHSAVVCIPNMPKFQKQRLLTLWRKAVRCVAGAQRHAGVDPIN